MQSDLAPRRVQFSSCDECRKSRVACDAGRVRSSVDDGSQSSCTRCTRRQRQCTFEWMKENGHGQASVNSRTAARGNTKSTRKRRNTGSRSIPRSEVSTHSNVELVRVESEDRGASSTLWAPSSGFPTPLSSASNLATDETPTALDCEWLRTIYIKSFESVFGSWMGRYSCPFVFGEQSLSEMSTSITECCRQLDRWMDESPDGSPVADIDMTMDSTIKQTMDAEIDRFMDQAIEAFAARWFHLAPHSHVRGSTADIAVNLWRRSRRDMAKVINRPSYRSMITLFLFALTPIPERVTEEEELDGVSGQFCVHAALQQIQMLRARQKSIQFNGAKVTLPVPKLTLISTSPSSMATARFINSESTAYWAALTFDTSASLTLGCRPMLSCGLFGFDSEPSWQMVNTCCEIFLGMSREWHDVPAEINDERANKIIAAGASWKLMVWKLTANLKEAIRDGHDEGQVLKAFKAVQDAIERFDYTYRRLLEACQRRIHFLNQETKLRWYELMLHTNLAILIVVDCLVANDRDDLLSRFITQRVDAEHWVLNTIVFGLTNEFALALDIDSHTTTSNTTESGHDVPMPSIRVPIISIDPYPHHVVAAVRLMQKAIDRDFAEGKVSLETYESLLATLAQALKHLPQCSKSVQVALANTHV